MKKEGKLDKTGTSRAGVLKRIKDLEITQAYAEYKMRSAGDMDGDLINWTFNIKRLIIKEKNRNIKKTR